jgi:hypothetical protein
MQLHYPEIALHVPSLLLPRPDISLETWAVIACDQYTSQPEYWEQVRKVVGADPSSLHLVFPEVYLESADREEVIAGINQRMQDYLASEVLVEQRPGFMLVERNVGRASTRKGLIVALDLEQYDYRDGTQKLIRTTEGTDEGRLPPRIQVRREASLETPHIMVLIDDPQRTVIEPLFLRDLEQAYDFDLMLGGGRLRGWRVDDGGLIDEVAGHIARLSRGEPPMAYAMGDGNHSFATARAVWEQIKAEAEDELLVMNHPARYAIVELVNVHDEGLEFAPIHRAVFGVEVEDVFDEMKTHCEGLGFSRQSFAERAEWEAACRLATALKGHHIPFISGGEYGLLSIAKPGFQLEVASLQAFLDRYLDAHPLASLDYIHGEQALEQLAASPDSIGFFLPVMDKHDLFETIVIDGVTPRKTFSLGEAEEKRYYLECRRLAP